MRKSFKRYGYDCTTRPCAPQCGHGRAGERWLYIVTHEDCALSLTVMTGRYTRYKRAKNNWGIEYPTGSDLTLHAPFYENADQDCDLIEGGRCFASYASTLGAVKFFKEAGGVDGFEQPESFWLALESRAKGLTEIAHAERDPLIESAEQALKLLRGNHDCHEHRE